MKTTTQPHNHKSILLLLTLCTFICISMQSKAQYFQAFYNETILEHDILHSGFKSNLFLQPTYVGCGVHFVNPPPNGNHSRMLRTDQTGTPIFNFGFDVADAATPTIYHNSRLNHIIEFKNGATPTRLFAVGGTGSNSFLGSTVIGGRDVLITKTFNNGAIMWTKSIDLNKGSDQAYCIKQSTLSPLFLYICGTTLYPGGDAEVFVMQIDTNGVVQWSSNIDYNQGVAHSRENIGRYLVEDAFGAVWVVGSSRMVGSLDYQSLLFEISAAGNPHPTKRFLYDYGTSDERFYSIRKNVIPGEYIIGGFTNVYNAAQLSDMHILKINLNVNPPVVVWDGVYNVNVNSPTSYDTCFDVIERANNALQYYAVGVSQDPLFQVTYETVLKLDINGVPLNAFGYGNNPAPNSSFGHAIDIVNPANALNAGFVTFGAYFANNYYNSYITKAYFNGVSGCNEPPAAYGYNLNNNLSYSGILNAPFINVHYTTNLTPSLLSATNTTLCYNPTLGAGSNAKTGINEGNEKATIVAYPNPIDYSNELHLQINTDEAAVYTMEILDAMGRSILLNEKNIIVGKNDFIIKLPELNAGIYFLKVNSPTGQTISKLIKE